MKVELFGEIWRCVNFSLLFEDVCLDLLERFSIPAGQNGPGDSTDLDRASNRSLEA
jgi:hypothetical protein